jgi:5-methyltetrahydrofolate--homocysteine methyltransferase
MLSVDAARANGERLEFGDRTDPAFTGARVLEPRLPELRELIDWQFFFLAWELKGKYPAILENAQARELFDDANELLDEIVAGQWLAARGGYGFWPAHAEGDDIVLAAGPDGEPRHSPGRKDTLRLPMLRQQTVKPEGRPNRCLADYVAAESDHLGAFAVAIHGAGELAQRYERENDDYKAIMVKALADRLAEAFAEYAHLHARRDWYEPDAAPSAEDLHAERFRGIRPAFGYPAAPDHSLKQELFGILGAGEFGMALTESFAMTPASSVSGLLFAHPAARYFTVGRLARDQVADYARRRGIPVDQAEHWLAPNLAYEPGAGR